MFVIYSCVYVVCITMHTYICMYACCWFVFNRKTKPFELINSVVAAGDISNTCLVWHMTANHPTDRQTTNSPLQQWTRQLTKRPTDHKHLVYRFSFLMKMFFIFLFCCCCFAAAVGSHSFCFCCYHQVLNQFALLFRLLFVYFVTAFSFTFSILLRYIFVKISAAFDSFFMALNEIIVKKQVFFFMYLFLVFLLSSLPALCSLYHHYNFSSPPICISALWWISTIFKTEWIFYHSTTRYWEAK